MTFDELSSRAGGSAFAALTSETPAFEDEQAAGVGYEWNLDSDRIVWARDPSCLVSFAAGDSFARGIDYAAHLSPLSPSSRYEAIMDGGLDTGTGVPFQVIYGLVPDARSASAPVWVEDSGRWFAGASGRPTRAIGTIRIVTQRYEEERRRMLAQQRDAVTDTFNQAYFVEQLGRHLTLSARKHTTFAIVLVELTFLNADHDAVAPETVLSLLADAAARMKETMRATEILARHGDRGFAILFENCNGEQMAIATKRLLDAAGELVAQNGTGPVKAILNAGGVIAPLHGRAPGDILTFAREALTIAQESATPFVRYEPEAARTAAKRRLIEASDAFVAALNDGRVIIALQPVVCAKTRRTVFHECLVRLRALDGRLIMPDVLVPTAEQGGLVALLDRRVADLAMERLAGDKTLHLSVNASVMSLHDKDWQKHFRAMCALYPDAARRLTIEITETCAVADLQATRSVLEMLKRLGIKIAIDDFGSGHSSFRNLRELPIDFLKIDGAFARNLTRSADDQFFVRTLIDLARNLQIPTVAEWVEDEETATLLTSLGVDYLQGHVFGKAECTNEMPKRIAIAS